MGPRRDLRQEQDAPHGGDEGDLGVHQEEQAQQGPHHHAGREAEEGPAVRLVQHVQDAGDAVAAHQSYRRCLAESHDMPALSRLLEYAIFDTWTLDFLTDVRSDLAEPCGGVTTDEAA